MALARSGSLGATRVCPHCKATVLQSAAKCPGCQGYLRFNSVGVGVGVGVGLGKSVGAGATAGKSVAAEPQAQPVTAVKIDGSIQHAVPGEQCEYQVVVAITNERGEKIARNVVGVGALLAGEKHNYSFSVELLPVRGFGGKRN